MGIKAKLTVMMICLIVCPLGVSAITWIGMGRMDLEVRQVTEEFAEARQLQVIERSINAAVMDLAAAPSQGAESALGHLRAAESGLVGFLASQHGSVAADEHQANEADHASEVARMLGELIGEGWSAQDHQQRLVSAEAILHRLNGLYNDAEEGVRAAPVLAEHARRRTLLLVVTASLIAAAVCIAVSAWSTRGVVRRLRELHTSLQTQSEQTSPPAPRDIEDVLTDIRTFNERLLVRMEEKNRELLRRERMAGIGLLAADVAHEINNPLNAMLGLSELSLRALSDDPLHDEARQEVRESLGIVIREINRCRGIVQRLMAIVRGPGQPQRFDATHILAETIEIARAARPDKARCFVSVAEHRGIMVTAPIEAVRQIVLTLLINAADAVSLDGQITADATHVDKEVWIRIRDNGRGFTKEAQARFDVPFSTSRVSEGGTGLGLSIAHALARDIGASLRSESFGPGVGSVFILVLRADDRSTS
jgi:signal transduction histidine kinase